MSPQELTAIRESLEMSKVQLADALEISRSTLHRYEDGSLAIPKTVELAAHYLRLTTGPAKQLADRLFETEAKLRQIRDLADQALPPPPDWSAYMADKRLQQG